MRGRKGVGLVPMNGRMLDHGRKCSKCLYVSCCALVNNFNRPSQIKCYSSRWYIFQFGWKSECCSIRDKACCSARAGVWQGMPSLHRGARIRLSCAPGPQFGLLIGCTVAENLAVANNAFRNLPSFPIQFFSISGPILSQAARYRSFRRTQLPYGRHPHSLPRRSTPSSHLRSARRLSHPRSAFLFFPLTPKHAASTMSFALVMRRSGLSMGRRMVRFESSTTTKAAEAAKETASKASSTASEVSSKATEGLSRVTSAAGPAIANAAKGVSGALGRVGGRTGRLVAFVERKEPPPTIPAANMLGPSLPSILCALGSCMV